MPPKHFWGWLYIYYKLHLGLPIYIFCCLPSTKKSAKPPQDLKTAFEPQREKLKTFNLKQIVTRNGTVLMNMLERLLESTEIDARDVETEQTLLEQLKKPKLLGGLMVVGNGW